MNDDQELSVPVAAVESHGSRKGQIAAVAIVSVVTIAIGLAAIAPGSRTGPATSAVALASASPAPTSAAPPRATPKPSPRVEEVLPVVPDIALDGAPTIAFYRSHGDDLEILGWTAGDDGLRVARTMPGALDGIARGAFTSGSVAPGGRLAFIRTIDGYATGPMDIARVVSPRGVIWENRRITARGDAIWSPDGSSVVIPVKPGHWKLLRLSKSPFRKGGWRTTSISLRVGGLGPPGPPPNLDYRVEPVAYSADGRWIYGQAIADVDRTKRSTFRVSTAGGRAHQIERLPSTGKAAAVSDRIDPTSGRTIAPSHAILIEGSTVVVDESDGTIAYRHAFPAVFGTVWLPDGRLVVLESDSYTSPKSLSLVPINGDGSLAQPFLETGPLSGAALLGEQRGFVIVAFASGYPRERVLIAAVRASDGTISGVEVPGSAVDDVLVGGWLSSEARR